MSVRVLIRDHPHRTVALTTSDHTLVFRHNHSTASQSQSGASSTLPPTDHRPNAAPHCMVEFAARSAIDLDGYRTVNKALGTLGLITLNKDVFLCAIIGASQVATVRSGETVQKIHSVEFYCLSRPDYDETHGHEPNPYPGESFASDDIDHGGGVDQGDSTAEHPFHALRKLLSNGNFYYSCDFDLTSRLQERAENDASFDIGSLDQDLLWNSYMVNPLLEFRSRLAESERRELDQSRMLTSVIRGFAKSLTIPPSSAPLRRAGPSHLPSMLTVISRLSSRRAGTRFNSRGIDDEGNVANFVETETIFWTPSGACFSYVQIRGSVPIFWESTTSLLPGQQKISVTRSPEATEPAFDKHFERLALVYGAVHIVNLLSVSKPGEVELTQNYRLHTRRSPLRQGGGKHESSEHSLLRQTEFDFHAETKAAGGYEGARAIRPLLETSADGFAYFMSEEIPEKAGKGSEVSRRAVVVLQQEGVFRVNCLDCLDRTNLVQSMISQMALEAFLSHRSEVVSPDFWMRHSSLWADNGDTLSKIYAGTGALKSSFTRHGKMSLAGAIADARKSATRLYVNNFADKGRQNTIDLLLGRLMGQAPVDLYDPVNDYVTAELLRRAPEYTSSEPIRIWCGTFNLNGRSHGASENLSPWLCSSFADPRWDPEIMAIGFQEIVELSPQQIMSTDPARLTSWEIAVKKTLNSRADRSPSDEYVLLRSGQLVGAALMIFVKASVLQHIKNVEGAIKKTGMSGIAGNKGAVAIRLEYASTSLCFVTAHLAAGFANYEERNRDYRTITHGLRFQKDRSIEDHESVIWFGDFNYRIGLSDDRARRLVQLGDLETLYDNDQLNIQMVAGMVFQYYSESRITFPPTYRFDIGTDNYDSSEKTRIPAWCDRVLRRGTNLRQMDYNMAPLRFSDHRPVFASFECTITLVDEAVKAQLSKRLYDKRKVEVGTRHAAADGADDEVDSNTDEEADLMGYESIAPGLPPASSDRKKWWLENDQPSRSEVRPPEEGMVPNPHRSINPFRKLSDEPDWVEVKRPDSSDTLRSFPRAGSGPKPEPPPARRTGRRVEAAGDRVSDPKVSMVGDGQTTLRDSSEPTAPPLHPPTSLSLNRSSSIASTRITKKTPPPKPKKPSSLASPPSQISTFPLASMSTTAARESTKATTIASPPTSPIATKSTLVQPRLGSSNVTPPPSQKAAQPQPRQPRQTSTPPPPRLPSRTNTSTSSSTTGPNPPDQQPPGPRATLKKPPTTSRRGSSRSTSGGGGGKFDPRLPNRTSSSSSSTLPQLTTNPTQPQPKPLPNQERDTAAAAAVAVSSRGGGGGADVHEEETAPRLPPRSGRTHPTVVSTSGSASTGTSHSRGGGGGGGGGGHVVDLLADDDGVIDQAKGGGGGGIKGWKPLIP